MEMKLVSGVLCLLLILCFPTVGSAAPFIGARLPGVSEPMLQAGFWIDRAPSPQQVILTSASIAAFNHSISAAMP
ncbi:MAG: hypothetical protein H6Q76_543, partial [Firmicutes bacterium]|nr:hypothetical protein [Bacillota bacterium]